jgi:predicted DNA-binding transcriptional regulator AlpA
MTAIAEQPSPVSSEALLIDAEEVARRLDVSPRTIWRLSSAGKLPRPLAVGGSRKWRADEIRRWVEAGCPIRSACDARSKRA